MSLISPHLLLTTFLLFLHRCTLSPAVSAIPHSDPADVAPLYLNPSPPATIPAFPEQSDAAGCPLDLSDGLFSAVKSACPAPRGHAYGELHRTRCCPVLAAWLYAAYSATALSRVGANSSASAGSSLPYDMPVLPDDSETCVDGLAEAMKEKGLKQLSHPNATCDLVYCYCGIRLHPLSCREEFFVTKKGKLGRSRNVKRLERDCLSHGGTGTVAGGGGNGYSGLSGCSKCLKSLHLINKNNASHASKSEEEEADRRRRSKMQHKDCELMGLTWLLSKNTTAYFHTVSNVLRAIMIDGSDSAQSCSLTTDGLPLAVASSQISGSSSIWPHLNDIITLILFIVVSIFLSSHLLVL